MAVFIGERTQLPIRQQEVTGDIVFFGQAEIRPGLHQNKPIDIIPRYGDGNIQTVTVLLKKGRDGQKDSVHIKSGYPNPSNPQQVSVRDEAFYPGEEINGIRFISDSLTVDGTKVLNRQLISEIWYEES